MLDIGTVKTSVYARWPKELNFDEPEEFLTDEGVRVYRVDDPSRYRAVCEVDWFDTPYRKVWFAARRIEMLKA